MIISRILKSFMNPTTSVSSLLWVDLQMSGLDPNKNRILEVACVLTDLKCENIIHGPEIIINCDKDHLDTMDAWCTQTHTKSGLVSRCLQSSISIQMAEKMILDWISKYQIPSKHLMIAGNSVHVDKTFIKKQMPKLDQFLHYRILDVTSLKIMMNTFASQKNYIKGNSHRALDDIKQSIGEYKFYTDFLFKGKK